MDLQSEKWDGAPIRVRMGIHTGKAELRVDDGSYFGYMTLSRVSRLMSVGCGGQVLLSYATQELVHDDLPGGIQLTDLGKWRLKNLKHPEHIFNWGFQVCPVIFRP
jgi:class 3 adenylate cyclase